MSRPRCISSASFLRLPFRLATIALLAGLPIVSGSVFAQEQQNREVEVPFAQEGQPDASAIADEALSTGGEQQTAPAEEPSASPVEQTQTRMLAPIPATNQQEQSNSAASTVNEPTIDELINRVADGMNDKQLYRLQYEMPEGQVFRFRTEHRASTEMRMSGYVEKSSMRSQSVKRWEIESVDSRGNMTFVYSIESTNDWSQVGDAPPVSFDSRNEGEVPEGYETTAEMIGKPLAVITINPSGQIIDKKTSLADFNFGIDQTAIPLPSDLVSIGHEWYVPTTLTATDEDKRQVVLNARIHYELARVRMPNAYIAFQTEVLTPVTSRAVESQIMQQMTRGYLVFDMQRGLPVRSEVEWDEQVQAFQGPDSYLSYVGKWNESLLAEGEQLPVMSIAPAPATTGSAVELQPRGGRPVMRR